MAKVCSFLQRQNGDVIGLVSLGEDKKPDLSTTRLVIVDLPDGENGGKVASKALFDKTNVRSSYEIPFLTHVDTVTGEETTIYDMDGLHPLGPKSSDPNVVVRWCNPFHLVNGPTGEVARAMFEFNGTPVRQPAAYLGRRNQDFVPEEDEPDPNAP